MKCLKCGTEWDAAENAGDIVACPACSAIHINGAIYDTLDGVLHAAFERLGEPLVRSDGRTLLGLFYDFAPSMRKEAKMLDGFLKCSGHITLLDAKDKSKAEVQAAAERVVYQMKEELMHEVYCRQIVSAFCSAIGCPLEESFGGDAAGTGAAGNLLAALRAGVVLCDHYTIQNQLEISASGANLFVCKRDDRLYVARVFPYTSAYRQGTLPSLRNLDHPCVARLYAAGEFRGYPVEIYPYFAEGSLQGHTFPEQTLVRWLIPDVNEGLHALHAAGLLHRGVKPSLLMHTGDGEHVCLMISKNTVLGTAAAGASRGDASERSDYRDFGLALYELFCGYAPSVGGGARQGGGEQLTFPKNMPPRLCALITGLTWSGAEQDGYRWGYREVCRWLSGEMPPVPGDTQKDAVWIPPYHFGTDHTDLSELSSALSQRWDEGKKELTEGRLTKYFQHWNLDLAQAAQDAEEEAAKNPETADLTFWQLLYRIDPKRSDFSWKGKAFDSLPALGREVTNLLWNRGTPGSAGAAELGYFTDILEQKLLSRYANFPAAASDRLRESAAQIEKVFDEDVSRGTRPDRALYLLGYLLSGQRVFLLDEEQICTTGELFAHMKSLLAVSYKKFESLCRRLVDPEGNLDPQLEAWLLALGKQDELARWTISMNT